VVAGQPQVHMPLNRMARFQVKKQLVTIDFSIDFSIDFEKKPCSLKKQLFY
jgi:hypothetical protein